MRAAKILAAVTLASLLGSTPSSSLTSARAIQGLRPCLPDGAISLLNSSGATGLALISSGRCSR